MFRNIKTLQYKITASFISFFALMVVIVGIVFWFEGQKDEYNRIFSHFDSICEEVQSIDRFEAHFLKDEIVKESFYEKQQSDYLPLRKNAVNNIYKEINILEENKKIKSFQAKKDLDLLVENLQSHEKQFKKIYDLVIYRGFKNYGIEGEMRKSIRQLEIIAEKNNISLIKILMLRRHEKDFIIRKEPQYVHKNEELWNSLYEEIETQNTRLPKEKQEILKALKNYKNTFFALVKSEISIGFDNKNGLRKDLAFTSSKIIKLAEKARREAKKEIIVLENQSKFSLFIILLTSIILMIVFIIYISRSLTKPLKQISTAIQDFVSSDFIKQKKLSLPNTKDEIGRLSNNFAFMIDKVYESIDRISAQNEEIRTQAEVVENKQRALTDSIRYAYQIQQAILPEREDVKKYFSDFSVIYEPLHIVSGDFYWFSGNSEHSFLAVVDCTGHGVPGAFMSMIANVLLNEIIDEKKYDNPAEILELLHQEIIYALSQEKDKNNDGLDIALCKIKKTTENDYEVVFSGAKMSVYYTDIFNNIVELRGIRRSVGGIQNDLELNKPFENHIFTLKNKAFIYLHSDGLTDIPNEERKKFGKKRLVECLANHSHSSLAVQTQKLKDELENFSSKNTMKRDDVTFVGLQI